MHKIPERLVRIFIVFFVLCILWYMPSDAFSDVQISSGIENSITGDVLATVGQDSFYRWNTDREEIMHIFNPYVDAFSYSGCIDHPGLRDLLLYGGIIEDTAYMLTYDSYGDVETAYDLHSFVYSSVEYTPVDADIDAEDVLFLGRGDCSEMSVLLASLLNVRGIKAYVAEGSGHRYVFARIDGAWFPIDASARDFYHAYKLWGSSGGNMYDVSDGQAFLFDRDRVIFNKDWCSNKSYV
ncbi:MAG: transglutaminase domain-containing protein [Candidatus Aenigmarchaeota archaeon]|nr:transglutaminase domain-containing protein [Candidatus Aenigmarchaeota archaeon]